MYYIGGNLRTLFMLSLLILLLSGCNAAPPDNAHTLTVFAAASLSEAFNALGEAFTAQNPA